MTIKIAGRQEVNISERRTGSGCRVSITPDDGPVNKEQLLAAAQRWCDQTIDAVPSSTAHAHLEEGQIVVSVVHPSRAQNRIDNRLEMLPAALQMTGKTNETEDAYAGSVT